MKALSFFASALRWLRDAFSSSSSLTDHLTEEEKKKYHHRTGGGPADGKRIVFRDSRKGRGYFSIPEDDTKAT